YYMPLFFEELGSLFDYLPDSTQLFSLPGIEDSASQFWADVRNRFEEHGIDPTRPLLPPAELFMAVEECFGRIRVSPRIVCDGRPLAAAAGVVNLGCSSPPEQPLDNKLERPVDLVEQLNAESKGRALFVAETAGRREVLLERLGRIALRPQPVDSW